MLVTFPGDPEQPIWLTDHVALVRGPGAVVKAAWLEGQRPRIRRPLWNSGFKETNGSLPLSRNNSVLWGTSAETARAYNTRSCELVPCTWYIGSKAT